jgi:hypothetical protein
VAWTLGLFACRWNSQVSPTAPWSRATLNPEHQDHEALHSSWHSDGVQVQHWVQCRVLILILTLFRFYSKLNLKSILPGKPENLLTPSMFIFLIYVIQFVHFQFSCFSKYFITIFTLTFTLSFMFFCNMLNKNPI